MYHTSRSDRRDKPDSSSRGHKRSREYSPHDSDDNDHHNRSNRSSHHHHHRQSSSSEVVYKKSRYEEKRNDHSVNKRYHDDDQRRGNDHHYNRRGDYKREDDDYQHSTGHHHRRENRREDHSSSSLAPPPSSSSSSSSSTRQQPSSPIGESYYDYDLRKQREQEQRERERREREKSMKEVLGYTNEENPFGDANLADKFIWKKREQVKKTDDVVTKKSSDLRSELLRAKENRLNRERELREAEEERDRLARERERSTYIEWEKKEEEFHLKQAKLKSDIRLKEGRAKPIDLIAKNLKLLDRIAGREQSGSLIEEPALSIDDIGIETREPSIIFKNLTLSELEDLRKDILTHMELDKTMKPFWNALLLVADDEILKTKTKEMSDGAQLPSSHIHPSVRKDIDDLLLSKTLTELENIETEIYQKTVNPGPYDDAEYWQYLMKELKIFKSKAFLREFHKTLLTEYRDQVQKEKTLLQAQSSVSESVAHEESYMVDEAVVDGEEVALSNTFNELLAAEESKRQLADGKAAYTEDEMLRAAQTDYEEGDDDFTDEVQLKRQYYAWNDKYRPRKPKYFNRVHTGYEWNKYNQVHYDFDNPPPKTIQGYKFNIFYPDLIDKTKAPQYFIEPGNTKDTCIIRFHAGPPYEDVAFKIVNREWEKSHRRGFKCTFERGILHLYFRFRRYRYKR